MQDQGVIRFAPRERLLRSLAAVTAVLTFGLLYVGALVTGTGSGLAVPDWPTTFGQNMFTYPLREMKGGVLFEHGHRLFASVVGLLTLLLTLGVLAWERRGWLRALAAAALVLVCAQGILGGLTVLHGLPVAVSSAHGTTAVLFFCTLLWLASALSPAWGRGGTWRPTRLARAGLALALLALLQTLAGAVARHSFAGLAIPTFPLAFGAWLPPEWSLPIGLNFLHTRVLALILAVGGLTLGVALLRRGPGGRKAGSLLLVVVASQILLGMLTIWTARNLWITSLHLAMGAALTGTLFVLALWNGKFAEPEPRSARAP